MKNLIIIGAGGMGRSVFGMAIGSVGYGVDFIVKGFIDDNIHALDGFENYPPVLGTIQGYEVCEDDVFVCSLGSTYTKRTICESLKAKGAKFQTLIHNNATIRHNARIGDGCIIAEYATVGSDCTIGENTLLQSFSVVGHDCIIGNYVRIDTHSTCVGGVIVKDAVTIHTTAVVSHNVVVGEGAVVAACSFVIRSVKAGSTVMGNPAKRLEF